jgi:hypothetical protein
MKLKSMLVALLLVIGLGVKASGNLSNAEAMYIYNFLRHIKWPESVTSDNFIIGVYGDSQTFDQLVAYTKGRMVGTKSILVKRIVSINEAKECQLIFVPHDKSKKISELKTALGNNPCLLVSEKEGMNPSGSTIEFVIQDDKLKFRINEIRAKQQNLIFSKALIDMAV